jgi:dTDP-4-dehydrorhamnose 3,5-epimerase
MKIIKQKIKGVYLIKNSFFKDNRGVFSRQYCKKELNKILPSIYQVNISKNPLKGTLRGFHYQIRKSAENKMITLLSGSIYDIVVDLRVKSKTYLEWQFFKLDEKVVDSIIIPKGCANAFLTLKNNTIISYLTSNSYNHELERGIRYNDCKFNFKWPIKIIKISKKDRSWKNYVLGKNS